MIAEILGLAVVFLCIVTVVRQRRFNRELKEEFDSRIELYQDMVIRRDERLRTLGAAVNDLRGNGKAKKSRYYEEALQDVELLIKVDNELHVRR